MTAVPPWFCELHRVWTTSDCPKCDDDLARAWDAGAEAIVDWIASNPGPSGIWTDPPTNPHRTGGAA